MYNESNNKSGWSFLKAEINISKLSLYFYWYELILLHRKLTMIQPNVFTD